MSARLTEAGSPSSLHDEGYQEALRHKWIESQKQGRDLGETALREWYHVHWPRYCRCKRLEHLVGRKCWQEFGDEDFGQLYSRIIAGDRLVNSILDLFDAGEENLEILNWALDGGLPMPSVVDILTQLDMNRARLEPIAV